METAAGKSGFAFTEENEAKLDNLLGRYPTKQAVVLPALWLAMDQNGFLTAEIMDYVAARLEQPPVQVYSVVEFYTMFHTEPVGEHHIQMCRTAFPDLKFTVNDMIAENDEVVVHWTAQGTQQDNFLGLSPTHRKATVGGTSIFRIKNGKIAEQWSDWNLLTLLGQLGIATTPKLQVTAV